MRITALIVLAILAPCCDFDDRVPANPEVQTNQGYFVTYDDRNGSVESGLLSLEQVHQMLALAVERDAEYLATKYVGPSKEVWIALAKDVKWTIYDDWWDEATGSNGTIDLSRAHTPITLALWDEASFGGPAPSDPCPALFHELGHVWWKELFLHGWEPELL